MLRLKATRCGPGATKATPERLSEWLSTHDVRSNNPTETDTVRLAKVLVRVSDDAQKGVAALQDEDTSEVLKAVYERQPHALGDVMASFVLATERKGGFDDATSFMGEEVPWSPGTTWRSVCKVASIHPLLKGSGNTGVLRRDAVCDTAKKALQVLRKRGEGATGAVAALLCVASTSLFFSRKLLESVRNTEQWDPAAFIRRLNAELGGGSLAKPAAAKLASKKGTKKKKRVFMVATKKGKKKKVYKKKASLCNYGLHAMVCMCTGSPFGCHTQQASRYMSEQKRSGPFAYRYGGSAFVSYNASASGFVPAPRLWLPLVSQPLCPLPCLFRRPSLNPSDPLPSQ